MNVDSLALKEITDRAFREIAQKAIYARQQNQKFDLIQEGHSARNRIQLAIQIVELNRVTPAVYKDKFHVWSQHALNPNEAPYTVHKNGPCTNSFCRMDVHCTCPDHVHRGVRCKHSLAVGLYLRSGGAI